MKIILIGLGILIGGILLVVGISWLVGFLGRIVINFFSTNHYINDESFDETIVRGIYIIAVILLVIVFSYMIGSLTIT